MEDALTGTTIRAAIELEPGEPLHGALSEGEGPLHPFVGWLGLAVAIEALRSSSEAGRSPERVEPNERRAE